MGIGHLWKMEVDLHIHTIASGHAYNTVYELAKDASEKQMKIIGIADHGPALIGGPCESYFKCLHRIPKELYGVRILKGIEANIVNCKGDIDISEEIIQPLHLVIAGFHGDTPYDGRRIAQHTAAGSRYPESSCQHHISPVYPSIPGGY